MSQLPKGWATHVSTTIGDTYYENMNTGETQWEFPTREPEEFPLPDGWQTHVSKTTGRRYYENLLTGENQWIRPTQEPVEFPFPNGWEMHISRTSGKRYYENLLTGEYQWLRPTQEPVEFPLPDGWEMHISRTSGKRFYRNLATGETQWIRPTKVAVQLSPVIEETECQNIKGLRNRGNSCYTDSILLALFAVPCEFTNLLLDIDLNANPIPENFLGGFPCGQTREVDLANRKQVQEQLRLIVNSIRGEGKQLKYCTNLRKTFKNCPDIENYYDNRQKDSGEFLGYLLNMFPLNVATKNTVTYATNSKDEFPDKNDLVEMLEGTVVDQKASVIQFIDDSTLLSLLGLGAINLSSFIEQKEDNYPYFFEGENLFKPDIGGEYIRRISYKTLISSPYIIFSLRRRSLLVEEEYIETEIIPDQIMQLPSGELFALSAIVLYTPGHYTCTFICNGEWYFYNDIPSNGMDYKLYKIGNGTYEEMLAVTNAYINGTQYFYIPISS